MKKMFLLFGMLAMVGILFVACSDQQDLTSPEEAAFKKGKGAAYTCTDELQAQKEALDEAIDVILLNVKSRKGAHQNVDNMARNVCAEPPDYDAALSTYSKFEIEIDLQNVNKLEGGETGRQALLDMAYTFASGGDYNPGFSIPPEALGEDGGLWVVPAGEAEELIVENGDFALRIEEGTFPDGAGDVTIVAYRLPDVFTNGDYSFAPYVPLPEIWWVESSVQVIPLDDGGTGFEIWQCMLDDEFIDSAVIAHALDEGGVELLPRLAGPPPSGFTCDNADDYVAIALGPSAPGWLQLAGSIVQPVVRTLFSVKPLHAMYFKGTGLGGRGGSLSPFAPVIPISAPAVAFDRSELNVYGSNYYYFNITNWADYPEYLFEEILPGGECSPRTLVDIFDADGDVLIETLDCEGSTEGLSEFSFGWPSGSNPADEVYVELWDQVLDVRYRSNTVAIPIVFNTVTVEGAGTGSGTVFRPADESPPTIDCQITAGTADEGDDCDHSAEEWVMYGGFIPTPDAGSTFTGWTGACTGTDPCLVPMDMDRTLVATFDLVDPPDYALSLSVGANGTVSDTLGNGPCGPSDTCSYGYSVDDFIGVPSLVFLRASPEVGYSENVTWVGCTNSLRLNCNVTAAASINVSAVFVPITSTLIVELTSFEPGGGLGVADGGTISDDTGNSCTFAEAALAPCTFDYVGDPGEVTISVTPDQGSPVWTSITGSDTGACDALPETDASPVSCQFTPSGSDRVVVNVWRDK